MKNIEEILNVFKSTIRDELYKELKKKDEQGIVHNHPPLPMKVEGCEYCKRYGNIFENYKLVEEKSLRKMN